MLMVPIAAAPRQQRHNVLQGEYEVSSDASLILTTVLGSCIACCLYDPVAGVGGMNHFLLPTPPEHVRSGPGEEARRYGLYAMEMLVNGMLKRGATRSTMRAHLYGGANLHSGMRAIGTENAEFARRFLRDDGIALARADTGGTLARRLDLQPASGRVRCREVAQAFPQLHRPAVSPTSGDVELF